MKFVTFYLNDQQNVGVMSKNDEEIIHIRKAQIELLGKVTFAHSLIECIQKGDTFLQEVKELLKLAEVDDNKNKYMIPRREVSLLAPIPRPLKNIFCVGKNYKDHAIEMGSEADIPKDPIIFTKLPTSVIGPNEIILRHEHITSSLDYEGELAVVIGRTGKDIKMVEAMDYIFGYTIINDVTARDRQKQHKQFFLGKSLDTSCPMGPYIIHKSSVSNPHHLSIETKVNGEVRQRSNTENLIFDIPTLISVISAGTTLEAGDIIATGTPAGVGSGFKPPRFLKGGDKVEITISELGTLCNRVQK